MYSDDCSSFETGFCYQKLKEIIYTAENIDLDQLWFEQLKKKRYYNEIKRVTIHADTVNIRHNIALPSRDIEIFAENIHIFDGAQLNTTPLHATTHTLVSAYEPIVTYSLAYRKAVMK
ncbi:hypothetical protein Q7C_2611 [Methylophaga frappieri]|uniref:Uncharacterized protein n=1 Tax=Methylophaga frappieri (strain ATCC BAA-2434 / DSM 25690 / JAM7) TaxID=754477 RepID=I1YLD9_METFJ|nr:hypothetical protein Q7C_2611 [Methylophaga frappieri]